MNFGYSTKEEQIELLSQVVTAIQSGEAEQDEALPEDVSSLDVEQFSRDPEMRPVRRSKGVLVSLFLFPSPISPLLLVNLVSY